MSEDIIKVKGLMSFKDVLTFSYETTAQSYLIVSVCMLLLLYTEIKQVGIWFLLVLLLLLGISFFLAMRLFAKKNYQRDITFQSEIEYTFSDTGFSITTKNGTYSVPWEQIQQIVFSKNLFTIYIGKKQAFLLPTSWFSNDKNLLEFKQTLSAHVPLKKFRRKIFYVF